MSSSASPQSSLRWTLRALRSRNYRLFFLGHGISVIGLWMTLVATPWLIYDLTDSPFLLGLGGFLLRIPSFFLSPFTGAMLDRHDRYPIVIGTQICRMLCSTALAGLALSGQVELWHLLSLSVVQGIVNAVDIPARQSLISQMVERPEDLSSAIALNSSLFSSGRLLGPALAGLLIAQTGPGLCFVVDACSYGAVILSLLSMRLPPHTPAQTPTDPWQSFKGGLVYVQGFLPIRAALLMVALASLMGSSYIVLGPVIAQEVLGGGSEVFGWLMSASGLGALLATFYLASRPNVLGLGPIIARAQGLLGIALVGFSLSRSLEISLAAVFVVGFALILHTVACNTWIQTLVEEDKRGRVMSLYSMAFVGMLPFGNLWSGYLADQLGVSMTLTLCGSFCVLGSLAFQLCLPQVDAQAQPIFAQKGITIAPGD